MGIEITQWHVVSAFSAVNAGCTAVCHFANPTSFALIAGSSTTMLALFGGVSGRSDPHYSTVVVATAASTASLQFLAHWKRTLKGAAFGSAPAVTAAQCAACATGFIGLQQAFQSQRNWHS